SRGPGGWQGACNAIPCGVRPGGMKRELAWWLRIAVPAVAVAAVGVGMVGSGVFGGSGTTDGDQPTGPTWPGGISLVAFDSCQSALDQLRGAALPLVGPYGLNGRIYNATDLGGPAVPPGAPVPGPAAPKAAAGAGTDQRDSEAAGGAAPQQAPDHSATNTHEAGVDEPDLVKTDGRRLITIADGKLRVLDVASRKLSATLEIPGGTPTQLLISGDRALVISAPVGREFSPPPNGRPVPQQDKPMPDGYQS